MQTENDIKELLKGEFDLEIPNFEKWNPPILNRQTKQPIDNQRRDWVSVSVDFWLDRKFHGTTPTLRDLWVKLLCVRAASGKRLRSVTVAWLQRRVGVQAASVERDIVKLLKLGLIDVAKTRKKDKKDKEEGRAFHELVQEAEKNLTNNGIPIYRSRFGDFYEDQLVDCYLHWQAKGKTRPFVTTLSNWHSIWVQKGSPPKLDLSWVKDALGEA